MLTGPLKIWQTLLCQSKAPKKTAYVYPSSGTVFQKTFGEEEISLKAAFYVLWVLRIHS